MSLGTRLCGLAGRKAWIGLSVGFGLLAIAGYYAYWAVVQHRFTTITAHQLYQSAQMPPETLLEVAAKHGIRTVIDLRTAEQAAEIESERKALEGSDLRYFHLPANHVPDEATVMKFLEIVGDPANRPVLIHCNHGTGRSVLFSSLFRLEFENWNNEIARRAVEPLHWRGNFAPEAPKGRYLLSYKRHHPRVIFGTHNPGTQNE